MAIVGRASVLVSPTFSGFQRSVTKELSSAGAAGGQVASKSFGSSLAKWGKAGAAAAGATVAAGFGVALTKGFGRLVAIENAQAKMRGLGHDTKTVDAIMKNALASVKGTAFGLGEAATTAAGAVAAGIKPGTELERVLKGVANSAAASGTTMEEMGAIFNKAASRGKAQNDILGQVAERGIPIYAALAKQMGVTQEEVFKLATEGKVSFEEFETAMTAASGTVASEMGKTFTGSLANTWAAFGRIGANLLSGVFDKLAPALQGATGWLEKMEPAAKRLGEGLGTFLDRAVTGVSGLYDLLVKGDFNGKMREAFGWEEDSKAIDFLFTVREGIEGIVKLFKGQGTGQLAKALGVDQGHVVIDMLQGVRDLVQVGIPKAFRTAREVAEGLFKLFTKRGTGQLAKALGVEQGSPVIKGLQTLRDVATTAFTGLGDAIGSLDFSSWSAFRESLSGIGGQASTDLEKMGSSLGKLAPKLGQVVSGLPKLAGSVGTILSAGLTVLVTTLGFLADNIDTVVKFLPAILAGFAAWKVASMGLAAQSNALQWAQAAMAPVLLANNTLRLINITLENRQTKARLANTAATAANTTSTAANNAAQQTGILARTRAVVAAAAHRAAMIAQTVATNAVTIAQRALNAVLRANPIGIIITAITLLVGALVVLYKKNETVREVIDRAWAGIKAAISAVGTWFKDVLWPWMRDAMTWIGDKANALWTTYIRPAFDNIWDKVKTVGAWVKDVLWPWMRDAFANIADRATNLKDKATTAFDGIRSGISTAWDAAKKILDRFKQGLDSLKDKFGSVRDGIAQVWSTVGAAIARPINVVIDTVNRFLENLRTNLNKIPGVKLDGTWGRIPHVPVPAAQTSSASTAGTGSGSTGPVRLADGSWVPGHSPHARADNIPAMLTAKEFVTRRWAALRMKRKHPGALEYINRHGELPRFADGGQVGGSLGDALAGGGRWLYDLFTDPGKALRGLADKALSSIGSSWPASVAVGAVRNTMGNLATWVKDKLFGGEGPEGASGPVGPAMGWQSLWGLVKGLFPDAVLTSAVRNSYIAGTRQKSLHASGRAIDFALNPWSRMVGATKLLSQLRRWTELIHTPAGSWQQNRGRNTSAFPEITKRMHRNHVHLGMADGGEVRRPFVADNGVMLGPRYNVLDNRTGGPEPLLRADLPLTLAPATIDALEARFERMMRDSRRSLIRELTTAANAGRA